MHTSKTIHYNGGRGGGGTVTVARFATAVVHLLFDNLNTVYAKDMSAWRQGDFEVYFQPYPSCLKFAPVPLK